MDSATNQPPKKLDLLNVWHDTTPRSGPENMAIDQLLLETITDLPLLRFYTWDKPSISFGYFDPHSTARAAFPDPSLHFTRRWTGGGIVDHRIDLTYTLAIPRTHPWATLRGAESYRLIHQSVAHALNQTGTTSSLTSQDTGDGSPTCFTNPVAHDIITPTGKKLAGAGQKRTRHGLLHQGSVIGINHTTNWQQAFTQHLTKSQNLWNPEVSFLHQANILANTRYATQEWLEKRP
ncbi:MAG: lipoate--protein ligase family protein [Akkermansiaceae bacterium]